MKVFGNSNAGAVCRPGSFVWLLGPVVMAISLVLLPAVSGAIAQVAIPDPDPSEENAVPGLPDFDIREQFERAAPPDKDQSLAIDRLAEQGVTVRWDDLFGTPRLIISYGGFLTGPDSRNPVDIVFDYLEQDDLFKFDPPIVIFGEEFGVLQEPDRPLVVGRVYNTTNVADGDDIGQISKTHVLLEQRRAGTGVFGAVVNFTLDEAGSITMMGAHYDRNGPPPGMPVLEAEDAVALAAEFGSADEGDEFAVIEEAEQVVFPMPFGTDNRWGWRVVVEVGHHGIYEIVIDAVSGEGLYRRNQMHTSGPEGTVYTDQNPCITTLSPCDLDMPVVMPFAGVNGSWVDGDTTAGNNAVAGHNPSGDDSFEYQPTVASQHFNFAYTDAIADVPMGQDGTDITTDRDFVITQAFYYVNMLHQKFYGLGFDEVAGNFQQDNFGRGGEENDRVRIFVDWAFEADPQLCCNASMWTPADGTSPVMRLRIGLASGGNLNMHRAMNGDTVTHEWAHGLSNRLVGGGSLGSGVQTGALGEGWSDAVATSLWDDPVYGEYNNGNTATGIRGVAYDDNSLTYASLCSGGCQVHRDGRIWASTLWDMRSALRSRWGANLGTIRHEQLIVDGMKNTPTNPSFLDARDGILAADVARYAGQNQCLIWAVFASRDMGFSAGSSGNGSSVTPADDAHPDCYPTADAGGPYDTVEGTPVDLDGTGSSASADPSGGEIVNYEWDFGNDGQFDDAVGPTPAFGLVGQDGVFPVSLRVTDSLGLSDEAGTTVTVENMPPFFQILVSDSPVDENSPVTVTGEARDPGWLDELTITVDWNDGSPVHTLSGPDIISTSNVGPGPAIVEFQISHVYGDRWEFPATFCVEDDHVQVCDEIDLTIENVPPTVEIDKSGAIDINGTPAILNQLGEPIDFTGHATDPGSDDLLLTWDWDDGTTTATMFLVNPPNPDPFPSPSIQPRDVTDMQTHTFGDACFYQVTFLAEDDDGGVSEPDEIAVVIVGNAERSRSQGYWSHQFNFRGRTDFDEPTLLCYLEIIGFVSQVFHAEVDASTIALAREVLSNRANRGDMRKLLDVQLLAAWLNFANGAIGYDELVDTTGDGMGDTPFSEAMAAAEAVRLDPAATRGELEAQKDIAEGINLRDE